MKDDYTALLKPEILHTVDGLALIARVMVDGYLSGLNKSRRVGAGLEFSQYRGYESGDDLRLLDWKMLARSGKYFIKQSEIDTQVTVKFIVDTSASMLHKEEGLSKIEYANVMVASLAYLAQRQGDAIGLYTVNDKNIEVLEPATGKQQFNRFLYQLLALQNQGSWPTSLVNEKLKNRSHKELLFIITDFYEKQEEITKTVAHLKTSRNEVVVLHIMGDNELNFNYKGQLIFEDLETRARVKVNTTEARSAYVELLESSMAKTKNELLSNAIDYQLFMLDDSLVDALQIFLRKRANLA